MSFTERSLKDKTHARLTMVASQLRPNGIQDSRLIEAFELVPREAFVPASVQSLAYSDANLPLDVSCKRVLLASLTLGQLIQLAEIKPEDKVLIIGFGTGYSLALGAALATHIVGVESNENFAKIASKYMINHGISHVHIITGALSVGYPKEAPYDVIIIEGAVARIPPLLLQQLAPQGRLVTIIREPKTFGRGIRIIKADNEFTQVEEFDANSPYLPEFEPKVGFCL